MKVLEEYGEQDDANFCVFAHFGGLSKMLEIQARHSRSKGCKHSMIPILNGIKVSHSYVIITSSLHDCYVFITSSLRHIKSRA